MHKILKNTEYKFFKIIHVFFTNIGQIRIRIESFNQNQKSYIK